MRVGIKSGCWTLIHSGHIWCFEQCKKQCDYLIILTNTDDYIENKKGSCPIPLSDRLYILQSIKHIDEVGYFAGHTEHFWIDKFKNERLCKEFGNDAKLVVFHSDELKNECNGRLPGLGIADQIVFIDKINRSESVSKIYEKIKGRSNG